MTATHPRDDAIIGDIGHNDGIIASPHHAIIIRHRRQGVNLRLSGPPERDGDRIIHVTGDLLPSHATPGGLILHRLTRGDLVSRERT